MRTIVLMTVSVLVAACGGGAGQVTGSVNGRAVDVKSASLFERQEAGRQVTYVLLSDSADYCTLLKGNRTPKNATALKIMVDVLQNGTPTTLTTGDYTVATPPQFATGKYASASISGADANCRETIPAAERNATAGFVTVTAYEKGKRLNGTFDITHGGRVTGYFNAELCDASQASSTPVCGE